MGADEYGLARHANVVGDIFPRWGDYGAAVTDGLNLWIASEWIEQTCTLDQYHQSFFTAPAGGDCGATRETFSNWSTRITRLDGGTT